MSAVVEISKQAQPGKEPIQKVEIKKGSGSKRGPRDGSGPRGVTKACPVTRKKSKGK